MGKFKDLTGKVFGRLTVLEATGERKQGAVVWKCKCECGNNEVYVSRAHLEQGNTSSCGCLLKEKVAERSKVRQTKDITGEKFGRLTAIEPTDQREGSSVIWKCKCECGATTLAALHNLTSGNTSSCGCLNAELAKENAVKNISKHIKTNYIAGTRLDFINNDKPNKNSTTGHKGVYLRKKDGKYIAHIEFQGKRYFLGSYYKIKEAIQARKEAESKLYGNFLEWYNSIKNKELKHEIK